MDIYKFLLIDIALVIAVIPILFFVQGGKKKISPFKKFNKVRLLSKTSFELPDKEKIIELEKIAKDQGSGVKFDSLLGDWKFISVWKKDKENLIFSSLLRIFDANINFTKELTTDCLPKFLVITSITLGVLTMEFSGSGYLKGEQPLLIFFFDLIQIKSGLKILFSRSLKEKEDKEKTFFSLIALEENGAWLSARGQGGALVIWLKD